METNIIPGKQNVKKISAAPGGSAEKVLRAILHGDGKEGVSRTIFGPVSSEDKTIKVYHQSLDEPREFEVVISEDPVGDIHLVDCYGDRSRLALTSRDNTLEIAGNASDFRIESLARLIVASYIVHGQNWTNRLGNQMKSPVGE